MLFLVAAGCGERSTEAVCDVWKTEGLALQNSFENAGSTGSGNPFEGLALLAGAPGRVSDLMDKMASVAPSDIEPSFKSLAEAFDAMAHTEGDALSDPFSALSGGLSAAFNAQGAAEEVNRYLAQNCGIPQS